MTTKKLLLQEIELMSEKQLSEMLILAQKIRQKSSEKLSKLMDEISEKAQAKGLTPEILEEITTEQIIDLANSSSAFNFLNNEPDIYNLEDGEAI